MRYYESAPGIITLVPDDGRPERCTFYGGPNHDPQGCVDCLRMRAWARLAVAQTDDGSGWAGVKLTEAPDVPAPSVLEIGEGSGDFLLRRGWVTLIHGRFASGKTPTTYLAVVGQVEQGRDAIIIDYEMGQSGAVALLRELGLTDGQIDRHVHYIERPPPLSPAGSRVLVEEVAAKGMHDVAVVVIDSLTQSMATLPGASDNDPLNVAVWADEMPIWLAQEFDAAVVIIDHSNLNDGDRPSGSHKKREFPQFHLWCELKTPFSRDNPEAGRSVLKVMKDRSGERPIGSPVAEVRTRPGGSFYLAKPDGAKAGEVEFHLDQQPEGGTLEDVYADLVKAGPEGLLKKALTGSGAAGTYRRNAFSVLVAEGRAVERPDPASSRARRCWADVHAP